MRTLITLLSAGLATTQAAAQTQVPSVEAVAAQLDSNIGRQEAILPSQHISKRRDAKPSKSPERKAQARSNRAAAADTAPH